MTRSSRIATTLLLTASFSLSAGEAEIVTARAHPEGTGSYRFDVTLRHSDTGWDHYADGWEVLSPDGKVLGKRVLYHPHVDEQPFTRSLSEVKVPAGTDHVLIRAHDLVHGYGSKQIQLQIP
jgi:hypothetical protein